MKTASTINQEIWEGYLATEPKENEPQPSNEDLSKAFTWGYIASLHVHAILDCEILFEEDINHARASIRGKVRSECKFSSVTAKIIHANLWDQTARYLFSDKSIHDVDETCRDAFIAGYKVALVANNRYDYCLFEDGHGVECSIMADLLSYDKKRENAARASARIVIAKYGLNREEYREMILNDKKADDTGKVIAEFHGNP